MFRQLMIHLRAFLSDFTAIRQLDTATLPRTTLPRTTTPRTTLPRTQKTTLPRIQRTTLPRRLVCWKSRINEAGFVFC
ncbi:unnamed protein product, partial [Didymodactylos carnosus]